MKWFPINLSKTTLSPAPHHRHQLDLLSFRTLSIAQKIRSSANFSRSFLLFSSENLSRILTISVLIEHLFMTYNSFRMLHLSLSVQIQHKEELGIHQSIINSIQRKKSLKYTSKVGCCLLLLPNFVLPTTTQCLFNSPWSAVSACRFFPQGVTAVVHGWLFVHWATVWARSRGIFMDSPWEELRVKGNTPNFILEHFIVLSFYGT